MSLKIVGIGEVLWDILPSGWQLGGAPTNFVYHASALGAEARLISRVGNDGPGREARQRLAQMGVNTDCLETDPALPTGLVTVELLAGGQPKYTIHENSAWDSIRGEPNGRPAVHAADAICFGTLAQRSHTSRATIRALLAEAQPSALRVLDVNLRAPYFSSTLVEDSLALANVLKLNDTELPLLAEWFGLEGDERGQIRQLAARFHLHCVAHTRGDCGSLLFSNGEWSDHQGIQTTVVDTVGAGDSFTAALVLGLLSEWPLDKIHHHAAELAAFVCSQPGGTPLIPDRLRAPFLRSPPISPAEISRT